MLPVWFLVSVAGIGGGLVSKAGPRVLALYQEWVGDKLTPLSASTDAPSTTTIAAPPTTPPVGTYAPGPRHPVAVDWIQAPASTAAPTGSFGVAPGERYPAAAPGPPGERYPAAASSYEVAEESPLQGTCAACREDPSRPCSCNSH